MGVDREETRLRMSRVEEVRDFGRVERNRVELRGVCAQCSIKEAKE